MTNISAAASSNHEQQVCSDKARIQELLNRSFDRIQELIHQDKLVEAKAELENAKKMEPAHPYVGVLRERIAAFEKRAREKGQKYLSMPVLVDRPRSI